jgi:hypothetical protein
MRHFLPTLLIALAAPAGLAAQPVRATYEVHALGGVVMDLEARFEVTEGGYSVETKLRTRGLAAMFVSGEQVSRVRGSFAGGTPTPATYASEGTWNGRPRSITMSWQGGQPRVLDMIPPNEEEREPVPENMTRGTMDVLSALAGLALQVGRAGACDVGAPVFDGRRRSDFAVRTQGRAMLPAWRGAWQGEALRCEIEGRQVAGFHRDRERAAAVTPQRGTAWLAAPYAGAPAVPVRLDVPTRWFGTATAVLLRAEPLERRADLGR